MPALEPLRRKEVLGIGQWFSFYREGLPIVQQAVGQLDQSMPTMQNTELSEGSLTSSIPQLLTTIPRKPLVLRLESMTSLFT